MFNATETINTIVNNIREWFNVNGPSASAVIGISGGKDSSVAAALLVRALGPDRVVGVMMPNGFQNDIDDSHRLVEALGIQPKTVDIQAAYDGLLNQLDMYATPDTKINLQPRLRMAALYMVAQSLPGGGRVINTCNRSEDYVGWATKFGDGAGDISILGNLLVTEILAIGDELKEIPNDLIHKTPSDGLCGASDEDKFGFSYAQLDEYILEGTTGYSNIDAKIYWMYKTSRHKYEPMYMCTEPTEGIY